MSAMNILEHVNTLSVSQSTPVLYWREGQGTGNALAICCGESIEETHLIARPGEGYDMEGLRVVHPGELDDHRRKALEMLASVSRHRALLIEGILSGECPMLAIEEVVEAASG